MDCVRKRAQSIFNSGEKSWLITQFPRGKRAMGETKIEVPRDRQASFDSIILPKHKRDVSDIENKVPAIQARKLAKSDACTVWMRRLRYFGHSGRRAQGNFETLDSKSRGVQEVHLIRNSLKYVPTRDYKDFFAHLKKIYGATSLKACRVEFELFAKTLRRLIPVFAT